MLEVLYIAYMSGAVILEWEHPCYWPNVVKVLTCGPNTPLFAMQRISDGGSSQGLAALNPVYLNCYVVRLLSVQHNHNYQPVMAEYFLLGRVCYTMLISDKATHYTALVRCYGWTDGKLNYRPSYLSTVQLQWVKRDNVTIYSG